MIPPKSKLSNLVFRLHRVAMAS